MIYAKGGASFFDADFKAAGAGFGQGTFKGSDTLWGWTVGGGAEYMLNPAWSLKVEYLHFDLGETTQHFVGGPTKFDVTADTVKAGVHFDRGYEPLK